MLGTMIRAVHAYFLGMLALPLVACSSTSTEETEETEPTPQALELFSCDFELSCGAMYWVAGEYPTLEPVESVECMQRLVATGTPGIVYQSGSGYPVHIVFVDDGSALRQKTNNDGTEAWPVELCRVEQSVEASVCEQTPQDCVFTLEDCAPTEGYETCDDVAAILAGG